jgi:Phage P22-like portal protein
MATLPPGIGLPSPQGLAVSDPRNAVPDPITGLRLSEQERVQHAWRAQKDTLLLDLARKRFHQAEDFEREWRDKALECLRFSSGEGQWAAEQIRQRSDPVNPRPCLRLNQTNKFVHQITNAEQQNRPGVKVRPVGSDSDVETAQAFDGLIRAIMFESDWDTVCDTAYDHCVKHGKGFWRVCTDYESPWSFNQVLRLERILNPFAVYLDPSGRKHPDYHTANWGFVIERMNRDHVCEKYEIPKMTWDAWTTQGDTWVSKDEAVIADYYYREELPVMLLQLRSGETRYIAMLTPQEDQDDEERAQEDHLLDTIAWQMARAQVFPMTQDVAGQVQQQRRSDLPVIRACKLVGQMVVERSIWPGRYIPIVPVIGDEIDVDGKLEYRGIIYDMMDAQREYNYLTSAMVETIALAPKAPFIGTVEQFRNRPEWLMANTHPYAYLAYNAHIVGNTILPPPHRQTAEPPIQAIAMARQGAQQDLYNVTGITPADLGEPSNTETSGKHAEIRRNESELGTSHYRSHLVWAVRHTARILVDLIPQIYREPGRVLRILGRDEQEKQVMLHPNPQGQEQQLQAQAGGLPPGLDGIYNLGAGTYDVVPDVGANYHTQRQEAAANLMDAAGAIPAVAQVMPDLIIGMQDFDQSQEAARRLKLTVDPRFLDDGGQRPEEKAVALQAQLQKTMQEAQALNAHAQQVEQALQQTGQENLQLKQDQAVKMRELALREREQQLKERALEFEREKMIYEGNIELQKAQIGMRTEIAEAREGD